MILDCQWYGFIPLAPMKEVDARKILSRFKHEGKHCYACSNVEDRPVRHFQFKLETMK